MSDIILPYNYREYEWENPIVQAFFDNKEIWMNIHRRGGKDLLCFCRFLLPSALKRPGTYPYTWPSLKQGRDAIWEGKDEEGRDILKHYVPQESILKQDNQDMKLTLKAEGGTSQIQIFGTNNGQYEALRGKPANGAVHSEHARQDPRGAEVVAPMILKTNGWTVYNSTPNGNNYFKAGYYMAKNNPDCYAITATVDDTFDHDGNRLVTEADIQKERDKGRTDDYINQEYYCSFTQGIEGTYIGKQLQIAENDNRIGNYIYDESVPVYTAWDLGVANFMAIIFYQLIGNEVHIIDYHEASGFSFVYYAQVLKDKGYLYQKHWAPHDIKAREMGPDSSKEKRALSRLEKAKKVGIKFDVIDRIYFENSVDNAITITSRCFFNNKSKGVRLLLTHLEQWGRKWNEQIQDYTDWERDDVHTHAGAAYRGMATVVMEETHSAKGEWAQWEAEQDAIALANANKYTGG